MAKKVSKELHPDQLPILGEFVIVGIIFSLTFMLKDENEVDDFIESVKSRCFEQGYDTNLVLNTINPIGKSIKGAMAEYKEEIG